MGGIHRPPLFVCVSRPLTPAPRLTAPAPCGRTWSGLGADGVQVLMLKRRSEPEVRLTMSNSAKHRIPIMREVM